ncbi:hypothetical protein [Staphylococcus nepalensis]|uniref:hypothetical protein n=1 Tax=Staphylococcus nepalensis TaxID=214473 RepID=UPI001C3F9742|nr:hypothetical protein [Staphylococcus nepalensis]
MREETLKIKYTIEYEKTVIFPADVNEEDSVIEERIDRDMDRDINEYTDSKIRDYSGATIIDRGF